MSFHHNLNSLNKLDYTLFEISLPIIDHHHRFIIGHVNRYFLKTLQYSCTKHSVISFNHSIFFSFYQKVNRNFVYHCISLHNNKFNINYFWIYQKLEKYTRYKFKILWFTFKNKWERIKESWFFLQHMHDFCIF